MKVTTYESFPFPEANDFGDGALDLQILAEAFDTKITAMLAGLGYMGRRETCIVTTSADSTAIPSGNQSIPFDTILYNNGFTFGTIGGVGSYPIPVVQGSYLAGAYINAVTTGALTAHHQRQLTMSCNEFVGPTHADIRGVSYTDTNYDSGGGAIGDFLSVQGTFNFQAFTSNPFTTFSYTFLNDNVAGGTTVVKAGALAWVTRISDLAL